MSAIPGQNRSAVHGILGKGGVMDHTYITLKKELPQSVYYPKFLQDSFLTASAKEQYLFLLERTLKEERSDSLGRLYTEISIEEQALYLSKSIATIKRGLLDMETEHLIERKRQGVGKVNRLYVML